MYYIGTFASPPQSTVHNGTDSIRGASQCVLMDQSEKRWEQLFAQAAVEHDPTKLLALIDEIYRLLEEKNNRRTVQIAYLNGDYRLFVPGPASVQ